MRGLTAKLGSGLTKRLIYTNIFGRLVEAPPDPIYGNVIAYNNDTDPRKVNIGIGTYRDENTQPIVLDTVRKAEAAIVADKTLNKVWH